MSTETKIDPFETPVWCLCGNDNDAEIVHAPLARSNDRREGVCRMWGDGGIWTSRSGWAATREELVERNGILPSCRRCSRPFSTKTWCKPYPEVLTRENLCFSCYHWMNEAIPKYGQPGKVVIGRNVYSFDPKRPMVAIRNDGQFYGHGGREFHIKLKATGEIVKTNNLWHGGQIPDRFAEEMPDNATFEQIPKPIGHGQGFLG